MRYHEVDGVISKQGGGEMMYEATAVLMRLHCKSGFTLPQDQGFTRSLSK